MHPVTYAGRVVRSSILVLKPARAALFAQRTLHGLRARRAMAAIGAGAAAVSAYLGAPAAHEVVSLEAHVATPIHATNGYQTHASWNRSLAGSRCCHLVPCGPAPGPICCVSAEAQMDALDTVKKRLTRALKGMTRRGAHASQVALTKLQRRQIQAAKKRVKQQLKNARAKHARSVLRAVRSAA